MDNSSSVVGGAMPFFEKDVEKNGTKLARQPSHRVLVLMCGSLWSLAPTSAWHGTTVPTPPMSCTRYRARS